MKLNLLLLLAAAMVNAAATTTPVDLGTASNYSILAKSGISTMPNSAITGNIGVSPIAASAITGFDLALDSAGQFSTASQIAGQAHAADYGGKVAAELTVAVLDMQAAYTDAASRTTADLARKELAGGLIGGQTLFPGVYTFTTNIPIHDDLYLDAQDDPDAVFIIQTTGFLTLATNNKVILLNEAKARNVFWQVAGYCATGAGSVMQGNLLIFTDVAIGTGATVIGGIYSQTAVNLHMAKITQAGVECRSASDCGDTTLFTCESNECKDIPCNMGQAGVECCGASDCGDTNVFTCESEQCVSHLCDTGQTGVDCCKDAECGDIASFQCESNSCVLRDCDTSLQDVECCNDGDCSSGGSGSITCVSNACINQGGPRFTLTWFGDGEFDF
jgi:hypothetical protein